MGYNLVLNGISSVVGYQKLYTITIDHTKCGSSDSTNFPVLVSLSGSNLKTVANGGFVQNTVSVAGITVPADLVFSSDNAGASPYSWEVEFYDPVNGILVAHVNIPTVSHTTNTVFYMPYDNSATTTFQGGSAGAAWNSNYKGVWHYPNGTSLTAADSTSFGNTATISSATATTGKIDGAASYASGNTIKAPNATQYNSTTGRWSFWVKNTQGSSGYNLLMARADAAAHNGITISQAAGTSQVFVQIYNNTTAVIGGTSGGAALNDGAWHKVSYEFNGASASTVYVDGTSAGSYTPSAAWNFNSQTVDTGKTTETFWTPYVGALDEERIMANNPGADWETTEYNNQNNPGNIGSAGFYTVT